MLESGKVHLEELGFTNIKIVHVPGAWELVHAAQKELEDADGVIAYGVVIRGETTHYELISESTSRGLMQVSVNANNPLDLVNCCRNLISSKRSELAHLN